MQAMMYSVLLNLVYFTAVSAMFFKQGNITNAGSLAVFAIGVVFSIATFIKYYTNSFSFDYFYTSFDNKDISAYHIYLHVIINITGVLCLEFGPSWSPIIPYFLMIVYTLIKKPYLYLK